MKKEDLIHELLDYFDETFLKDCFEATQDCFESKYDLATSHEYFHIETNANEDLVRLCFKYDNKHILEDYKGDAELDKYDGGTMYIAEPELIEVSLKSDWIPLSLLGKYDC